MARFFSRCSIIVHASSKIDSSTLLIRLKIEKEYFNNFNNRNQTEMVVVIHRILMMDLM